MEKPKCPVCKGMAVKNGKQNGKQRFKCTVCKRRFQLNYTYKAYLPIIDDQICTLLKEGCGTRSISRILKISKGTVLSRMLQIGGQIRAPLFSKPGCKFEIDELWSFVGKKENVVWITYAIERTSGQVVGFVVGNKTIANIKPLVNKVLLYSPIKIYTDGLNMYPGLIPKRIHRVFKSCTNKIERNNLTLRMHVKRLSRRTLCFSKSAEHLEAHLRIYFWG